MAESDASRLDHRVPLDRPEIRHVGSGWDGPVRAEASAPLAMPLVVPGGNPPAPAVIVAPAPTPTESELRELLTECLAAKSFADENLQRARETSDRAARHAERCRGALGSYAGLDDEITQATVEALRGGEGRPRHDVNDELRRRVASRDVAKADADAATRAEKVLADDLYAARADAASAARAANTAAAALTMIVAEAMAQRVIEMENEAARLREILHGADVVGVTTPKAVKMIYADGSRFLKPVDRSAWSALRDRLLADPTVELQL
jgi:hypothetical protein